MTFQLNDFTEQQNNLVISNNHKTSVDQIFSLINLETGYDFSSYKLKTIYRRIEKQMHRHNLTEIDNYVCLLRRSPEEVYNLYKDLLIGVTRFFRDNEAFSELKNNILQKILQNKPSNYCLRVWVPGCSTGEEVYSIAIIIAECMEELNNRFRVQIFGTDIDSQALILARSGNYSETIAQDISQERLDRYFTKAKNTYKIKKELRSMVIFGEQNIIKDPPFTKVDIISCRNLLIYLDVKLQRKILPIFHYSLKSNGVLFLGMSESIAGHGDLFGFVNRKVKVFQRKDTSSALHNVLSFHKSLHNNDIDFHEKNIKVPISLCPDSSQVLKNILLDKLVWPSVLVSKSGEILYLHGEVNKYIGSYPSLKNLSIFDVVPYSIKNLLKSAIYAAILKNKVIFYHGIYIKKYNELHKVNLRVSMFNKEFFLSNTLLVSFEDSSEKNANLEFNATKEVIPQESSKLIDELKSELLYTKENLQSTIEELESSNEELQSMNEELQSTNEEIESSKDELRTLNDELIITNTQLQKRIDQLASVHDDMSNLFNSTDIATLFLDSTLCIKQFTPKAQELIHLIPTDIGRSISHFATNIKYDKLQEDAEEVLKTLNQKCVEVQSKSDQWFLVRILPYRTIANMIDGVVITLVDITENKNVETKCNVLNKALENALSCTKNILETVMVPLLVLTMDLKIVSANRSFYKKFFMLPEDVLGKFIYDIDEWNIPLLTELLQKNFPEDNSAEGFIIEKSFYNHGYTIVNCNARKIINDNSNSDMILLAMEPK